MEQNLSRILGYVSTTFWRLLPAEERARRAPEVEAALWAGVTGPLPATARAAFFGTYRGIALTDARRRSPAAALGRGRRSSRGCPLSESDQTALATELALREVDGWTGILDAPGGAHHQSRPEGALPLRARRRWTPIRQCAWPSSARWRTRRTASGSRGCSPGLDNLHHPLRAESALPTIRPALDMIEEIQRTGDIFFPGRWLDATLGGHNEAEAAETVRTFLDARPDLPPRLRAKVLQSADMLWRAARHRARLEARPALSSRCRASAARRFGPRPSATLR